MVRLINRKRVPLLHKTVLILCDEEDGLVVYYNLWNSAFRYEHASFKKDFMHVSWCASKIRILSKFL